MPTDATTRRAEIEKRLREIALWLAEIPGKPNFKWSQAMIDVTRRNRWAERATYQRELAALAAAKPEETPHAK